MITRIVVHNEDGSQTVAMPVDVVTVNAEQAAADDTPPTTRHDTPPGVAAAATAHAARRELAAQLGEVDPGPWAALSGLRQAMLIEMANAFAAGAIKTPAQLHDAWIQRMTALAWTYGPQFNAATRQHPNLVAYAELTNAQRTKDALTFAIFTALSQPV